MNRFRRWLFNGLAAMSLALSLAIIAVWIRSEFCYDCYFRIIEGPSTGFHADGFNHAVITDDGRVVFLRDRVTFDTPKQGPFVRPWRHVPADGYVGQGPHGDFDNVRWFWFWQGPWGSHPADTRTEVVIRIWMLLAITALLPTAWLIRRRRKRRVEAAGICSNCGYDLRATPDRCPECGAIPVRLRSKKGEV